MYIIVLSVEFVYTNYIEIKWLSRTISYEFVFYVSSLIATSNKQIILKTIFSSYLNESVNS